MALDTRNLRASIFKGNIHHTDLDSTTMERAEDYSAPLEIQPGDIIQVIPVSNIDDPSTELNALDATSAGSMLITCDSSATQDEYVLYVWDVADSAGEDVPYTVDGSAGTGKWVAVAGKYVGDSMNIKGALNLLAGLSVTGIVHVKGAQDTDAILRLSADAADDDVDQWRLVADENAKGFTLETFSTGSWVAVMTVNATNDVTLVNDLDVTTDLRVGNDITAAAGDVEATAGNLIAPTDNKGLVTGGASDASVYYDGVALVLKTDNIAASDLDIITGAQKTIALQTVVYDDLRVPLQNTKINPLNSEPAFENFADGLFAFAFEATNADDESLHFVAQLPHAYKEGTNIVPHVHWMPSSTNAGDVVWELEYIWVNVNGTTPGSTSVTVTDAGDGVALKQQKAIFAALDGTGKTISSVLTGRLTRLTSHIDDDFTGIAYGLEIDFHFEMNTIGSRQPLVK